MIERHLSKVILEASGQYPVVAVTGPRQSGKTTLCRVLFPGYAYVNLEKPDVRAYAKEDPNGFLAQFGKPVILDEVQQAPELFSYIMPLVDKHKIMGEYILSGSLNFLCQEAVSQSLAGRCATMKLLPLSHRELAVKPNLDVLHLTTSPIEDPPDASAPFEQVFKGGFPPLYDRNIKPANWLAQYTQSYLERDVRKLINVGDLDTFERFLRLAAGRSGQLLNMDSLASDIGVSPVTVKRWISLLMASYTVFLLRPHMRNFNKRLIKSPKLYFFDTGLLCYLLNIRSAKELELHSQRGAIFETFIVSEMIKSCFNAGIEPPLYFWRDSQGNEVDLIVENGELLFPIEIKSAQTYSTAMVHALNYWQKLDNSQNAMLIYAGAESYTRNGIDVRSWNFV